MGRIFVATDLYTVGSFDPDHDAVMRIGGEAPGGGPILSVGIKCHVRIRGPATSDRQFGSPPKGQREHRAGKRGCSFRAFNLPDAG